MMESKLRIIGATTPSAWRVGVLLQLSLISMPMDQGTSLEMACPPSFISMATVRSVQKRMDDMQGRRRLEWWR